MRAFVDIDSRDDPRVAEYLDLRPGAAGPAPARSGGVFVAEGEIVVRLAAASRFRIRSLLVIPGKVEPLRELVGALPVGVPVYVAPQPLLSSIVGYKFHRGAMACCERAGVRSAAEVIAGASSLMILDQLSDPDNVGSIFRTVSALGGCAPGVLLGPGCADPLSRKALRVSMGHALHVAYAECSAWPKVLEDVAGAGFSLVGLCTGDSAVDLRTLGPGVRCRPAFVVGSEGTGISDQVLGVLDRLGVRAGIRMRPGVDSLNVNVAAAVALFSAGLE